MSIYIYIYVPYDGLGRQRVLFIPADCLAEALCSRVYVAEECGVVSVGRVKIPGELRLAEANLSL